MRTKKMENIQTVYSRTMAVCSSTLKSKMCFSFCLNFNLFPHLKLLGGPSSYLEFLGGSRFECSTYLITGSQLKKTSCIWCLTSHVLHIVQLRSPIQHFELLFNKKWKTGIYSTRWLLDSCSSLTSLQNR